MSGGQTFGWHKLSRRVSPLQTLTYPFCQLNTKGQVGSSKAQSFYKWVLVQRKGPRHTWWFAFGVHFKAT